MTQYPTRSYTRSYEKLLESSGFDLTDALRMPPTLSECVSGGRLVLRGSMDTQFFGERNNLTFTDKFNRGSKFYDESYGQDGPFGMVDSTVRLNYSNHLVFNPMALKEDGAWSRMCLPWGEDSSLERMIDRNSNNRDRDAEGLGGGYYTFTEWQKRKEVYTSVRSAIVVQDTENPDDTFFVKEYGHFKAGGRNHMSRLFGRGGISLSSARCDDELVSHVKCGTAMVTFTSDSDIALVTWSRSVGTFGWKREEFVALANLKTGDIQDLGCYQPEESSRDWQALLLEDCLPTEPGILPTGNNKIVPVVENGVALGSILMVSSFGLRNTPGEDPTNISGWDLSEDTTRAVKLAKDAIENEKYEYLTKSPRAHARHLLRSKEGIWDSLGISV